MRRGQAKRTSRRNVPWLDSIPEHWRVLPSKRLFSEQKQRALDEDEQLTASQAYGVIRQAEYIERTGQRVVQIFKNLEQRKHVEPDDFVISMRSFEGGLERAWARGCIRSSYVVLRPSPVANVGYYSRLFKSDIYIRALQATSHFIRDGQDLNFENFVLVDLPHPPEHEQLAIATFLDSKTVAIDALIAKKERLIKLLQEKRQALITQAVTKGLDPSVPMKESGIEWLGQIPTHWTLRRLKHLGQIRSGIAKGRDVAGRATLALPYLRVANVQNGWLNLDEVSTIEVTREEAHRYALRPGDVLMNEGGDFDKLGRGYVWEGQIPDCIHQNHVFALRPRRTVDPYWVNLATQASYLRHFFILRAKQSTNLASISSTNLGEAPIPMPPEREVVAILLELRAQLGQIDRLLLSLSTHVERLYEYRQALITAAVTGNIDVTNSSEAA